MSATRKTKNSEPTKTDISDLYYLTINEVCERTTYDRSSINAFIRDGKLKTEKKNGGKRLVKVSDFEAWWKSIDS